MRLYTVYVPTNHVYVGDIFMLEDKDIIHTNLSVREGLGKCSIEVQSHFLHVDTWWFDTNA